MRLSHVTQKCPFILVSGFHFSIYKYLSNVSKEEKVYTIHYSIVYFITLHVLSELFFIPLHLYPTWTNIFKDKK